MIKNASVNTQLFKKLFMYSAAFFVCFYVLLGLFSVVFGFTAEQLSPFLAMTDVSSIPVDSLSGIYQTIVFTFMMVIILVLAQVYNFSFFESLMWSTIFGNKTTVKSVHKFLALSVLFSALLAAWNALVFFSIAQLQGAFVKIGVIIMSASLLLSMYLLIISFISFGKTHTVFKSIKNAFIIGLGGFRYTYVSLLIAAGFFIIINLILYGLQILPSVVYLIVQGLSLSAFLAWFRIHLAHSLKSVKF